MCGEGRGRSREIDFQPLIEEASGGRSRSLRVKTTQFIFGVYLFGADQCDFFKFIFWEVVIWCG